MINQDNLMEYIVEQISVKNELHSKKVIKNLSKFDSDYFSRANDFMKRYVKLLQNEDKSLDYSIDCYLQMIADVNYESVQFLRTGEYTSKSFDEVNQRVYNNPQVMEYYMHGLLLSQFLWSHHYDILLYFNKVIKENSANINHYLEVGGGHGLYISEAINIIGDRARYDLVDISKSSIEIAKKMISDDKVNYILLDVFKYFPEHKYDFITMGEVLEHVEDPVGLLKKLHSLLSGDGKLFITTPTNAPAIDHIYLFKNADDIRNVISDAGFDIENEQCIYSEDMPKEKAEKFKISMMYAAIIKPKK
jgi:2-polyprenyl-3-methyl-5-hydroxy-6-metoxy-1,4-benzoquinol methylase